MAKQRSRRRHQASVAEGVLAASGWGPGASRTPTPESERDPPRLRPVPLALPCACPAPAPPGGSRPEKRSACPPRARRNTHSCTRTHTRTGTRAHTHTRRVRPPLSGVRATPCRRVPEAPAGMRRALERAAPHRPESHSSEGSRPQDAPSGFFTSVGFLQGGGGGALGSGGCRRRCQSSRPSHSFRRQSRSSCRAALSFWESRSCWMTCGGEEGRLGAAGASGRGRATPGLLSELASRPPGAAAWGNRPHPGAGSCQVQAANTAEEGGQEHRLRRETSRGFQERALVGGPFALYDHTPS